MSPNVIFFPLSLVKGEGDTGGEGCRNSLMLAAAAVTLHCRVGVEMSGRKGVPSVDLLPEHFPYRDDGCDVAPSCLSCPLPRCKYDDPGCLTRERRARRDQAVLDVRSSEGITVMELARRFHISQRTVHRILSPANSPREGST